MSLLPDLSQKFDAETLEEQAVRYLRAEAFTQALTCQEQAMALHATHDCPDGQARCAQSIGHLYFMMHNHDAAMKSHEIAAALHHQRGDFKGQAAAWSDIAEVKQHLGEHVGALAAYERALGFLRRGSHLKDIALVLNNMAVSLRETGQRQEAFRCHERALEIRRDLCDFDGLAASLHNVGVLHADAGQLEAAHKALAEARSLRLTLNDIPGLARTELRIGMLHEEQGELEEAVGCYGRALLGVSGGLSSNVDDEAAALTNLAGILVSQGDAAGAMPLLDRAQARLRSVMAPAPASLATVGYTLGLAQAALGQCDKALDTLLEALSIQQRCCDRAAQSCTLAALGTISARQGKPVHAQALLNEALLLQIELDDDKAQAWTLTLLAQVSVQQGLLEAAAEYHALAARRRLWVSACDRLSAGGEAPSARTPYPAQATVAACQSLQ